ncbi:hypothetical protein N7326_05025 [Corynebacterium sp. ES2794-CONJ1]|uniref:hypothetical protein n=1 Tax=unclassified Corynebacterium TaxID=2624378 RepID=UPI0021690DE8|nr:MULTISPECIES: hypothetical protein [unclassified Corynebacterium]MCS4489902.1 hypothetical protein [Corynebacterium sp. ES2775-CONJ]MCS4491735.1 hypothetical protein [Corynebacterium sp. ES2715-CONJ3]MCS4531840.1 hypothetical protein [Corynebacterium sp. ES2730-CONJ]MCU9519236.1 hypothetical protein [Corynebacterium sp. ES2794-CONJ1]
MIILIDGRSGSGKTTLAATLSRVLDYEVIHLDDFYPGWEGLAAGREIVARSILQANRAGYFRWNWEENKRGEWVPVDMSALKNPRRGLIVEGVGAISLEAIKAARRFCRTHLILLELETEQRKKRALDRDPDYAPYWDLWARQEDEHFEELEKLIATSAHAQYFSNLQRIRG